MGAVAVLSIVSAAGVIDMDRVAVVDACGQQLILFCMKAIFFFGEDATDLSTGDIDPPFGQLLADQGLGDALMVILVEDIALEDDAEVTAL